MVGRRALCGHSCFTAVPVRRRPAGMGRYSSARKSRQLSQGRDVAGRDLRVGSWNRRGGIDGGAGLLVMAHEGIGDFRGASGVLMPGDGIRDGVVSEGSHLKSPSVCAASRGPVDSDSAVLSIVYERAPARGEAGRANAGRKSHRRAATASISTLAPSGSPAAWTVARAGGSDSK